MPDMDPMGYTIWVNYNIFEHFINLNFRQRRIHNTKSTFAVRLCECLFTTRDSKTRSHRSTPKKDRCCLGQNGCFQEATVDSGKPIWQGTIYI